MTSSPSVTPLRRFDSRTVLVTGAGAGIGAATARRFAAEGATVLLVDRDATALQQVLHSCGPAAFGCTVDVADAQQSAEAMDAFVARHGRIHAAVLNAGIEGRRAPLHEATVDDFDRVIAVNVRGVFLWLSRLMGHMRSHTGGAISITSSIAGLRGAQGMAPYVASKHAVIGLMKSAALEGASHGVRVNCVNPGPVDTRMMDAIDASAGDLAEVRARTFARIPLRRYASADEIAALTAFLCSDEASYCTGAVYLADGGSMAGA